MTLRERKVLAIGGGVVGGVLLLRGLAVLVAWYAVASERVETRRAVITSAKVELAQMAALEDSAESAHAWLERVMQMTLSAPTLFEAQAAIALRLRHAAGPSGVMVLSTDLVPDSTLLGLVGRVSVTVELESDFEGLMEFLRALAADTLPLEWSSLRVEAADPDSPQSEILRAVGTARAWYAERGRTVVRSQ